MSERQLAELTGNLVRHQHCFGVMSNEDKQWTINNPAAAIGLFADAVKNRDNDKTAEPKKLLQLMTTTPVAVIDSFRAADHFKIDTKKATVRIAWLGDNFKANFIGLSEGACEAVDIKTHKLLKSSLDTPIITELGDRAEITLGQLFALLQKQGNGGAGALLVNGHVNIAYIRDVDGNLWAVDACWSADDGGWCVGAYSVGDQSGWSAGRQVLSR